LDHVPVHTRAYENMVNSVALAVPLGIVGGLFGLWHALTWYEVDYKCERPKFAVARRIPAGRLWYGATKTVEVRKYAPYIVASYTADSEAGMRDALGKGFMSVAGYIFGKNQSPSGDSTKVAMTSPVVSTKTSEKIAMTSPVVSTKKTSEKIAMTAPVASTNTGSGYTVSFIMPSKYTMETLPKPTNERVTLHEVPGKTMAALGWRGPSVKEEVMNSYASELRAVLEKEGIKVKGSGEVSLYQYHPPFAPPWMRQNEVLFEVDFD
jgi:hypothetical protein